MKKFVFGILLGLSVSSFAFAECGATFSPGGECPKPEVEKRTIPYFNTVNNTSTRFGITNPTNSKVVVTVSVFDTQGNFVDKLDAVLNPFAVLVSALTGTESGTTTWFIPPDDSSCKTFEGKELSVSEGYLEITSSVVPTFGPGGFCGNDYTTIPVNTLYFDYSIWDGSRLVNDQKELFSLEFPVHSSWTGVGNRSTSIVVNKANKECETLTYEIFNRKGNSVSGGNLFCGKVVVIPVGPDPFFTSTVSQSSVFANNPFDAGWIRINTVGSVVTIRSEF